MSIDPKVEIPFREYCTRRGMKITAVVEELIKAALYDEGMVGSEELTGVESIRESHPQVGTRDGVSAALPGTEEG